MTKRCEVRVAETGRRYVPYCSCGWRSGMRYRWRFLARIVACEHLR